MGLRVPAGKKPRLRGGLGGARSRSPHLRPGLLRLGLAPERLRSVQRAAREQGPSIALGLLTKHQEHVPAFRAGTGRGAGGGGVSAIFFWGGLQGKNAPLRRGSILARVRWFCWTHLAWVSNPEQRKPQHEHFQDCLGRCHSTRARCRG